MSHAAREHNVQPSQASLRSATLEDTADVNDSWPLPRGLFPILPTSPVTPTPDHTNSDYSYAPFEPPIETHLRSPAAYFKRQRERRRQQFLRQKNNRNQQLNSGSDHGGMTNQKHVHAKTQQRSLITVRHADSYTDAANSTSSPCPIPWPMPNRLQPLNTVDDDKSFEDDDDKLEQEEEDRLNINSAVVHSPTDSTLLDSHHLLLEQQGQQPSPQSQPLALRPLPSVDLSTDDSFHTPPESANEDSGFGAALDHISRIYPTAAAKAPTFIEPTTRDKSDSIDHVSKSKSDPHLTPASSSAVHSNSNSDSDSVVDVVDLFADVHMTHEENPDEALMVNLGQSHSNRTTPRHKGPGDTSFLNIEGLRSLFSDDPPQYTEYITKKKKNLRRSHSDLSPTLQPAMEESNDLARSSSTQQMNHNNNENGKRRHKKKKKKQQSSPLTNTAHEEFGQELIEAEYKPAGDKEALIQRSQHSRNHHHHAEVFPSSAILDTSIPGASISPLAQDSYQSLSPHGRKSPEGFSNRSPNGKPPLPPTQVPNTAISDDIYYDTPAIRDTKASATPPNDLPPIVMMSSLTGDDSVMSPPNDNSIQRQMAASQHPTLITNETGTPRQGDHLLGKTGVIVRDVPNRPPYHGIRRAETGFIMSRAELELDDPPNLFSDNPNPKSLAYFQPPPPYDAGSLGSSLDASPQRLIKDEYSSSTSSESNGSSSGSQPPQNSPIAQASHAYQHRHGTGLPNTHNADEPMSRSLAHLSVAANAGSITPTDTPLDTSRGSTMAGSSGVGRITGSSGGGGGGSGWSLRRRSDDTGSGSNTHVGLVSKLSSGIRRAARAMTKRTPGGVDGSQHDSSASPRVSSPKGKGASDLVLSGSVDEAVCRMTYVCRQRLGCQVNVRESGKKIKVQLIDDERAIWLKLSIVLSKLDDGVRVKISQTKAEAEQCNITTLWEFYSKLERCLQETEQMGSAGVIGI